MEMWRGACDDVIIPVFGECIVRILVMTGVITGTWGDVTGVRDRARSGTGGHVGPQCDVTRGQECARKGILGYEIVLA